MITNDKMNKLKALSEGLRCLDVRTFVDQFLSNYPEFADLIAAEADYLSPQAEHKQLLYPPHVGMSEISAGLRSGRYLRGCLRSRRDDWKDCYVTAHIDQTRTSVAVQGVLNVNRAMDGDIVAVELLPRTARPAAQPAIWDGRQQLGGAEVSPASLDGPPDGEAPAESEGSGLQGRVVGVVRRSWRQYAGSLDWQPGDGEDGLLTFLPADCKVPPVLLASGRARQLAGQRLLVQVDQWPANSPLPLGHFVRALGREGDKEAETALLLHEFAVPHEPFTAEVMACLPDGSWSIPPEELSRRTDLRHLPVASIDPPGCRDIDDALHCVRLANGNLQAGVHIADVTHFLLPDTALDKEAAARSTSTYLVERRLDMLPGLLTTQLCSLRCTEDHLAFSVLWEMDDDANIVGEVQFCKSIIRSKASLTYDEAQAMLDAPSEGTGGTQQSVKLLNQLAHRLRQRRIEMGALTLASPEVRFQLDDTQNPTDVSMYALKESNALVEEWMLLANITVSKKILRHYPTLAVLRRHQPPSREQFQPLVSAAAAVGVSLDISSSKALADSLDLAVRADDPYFNKLLRVLSTRCMMPAQYFCSGELPPDQWHHYGLAAPIYSHFTSPIRRYADVLVHRLLAAAIGVAPLPAANADRSRQRDLCTHMNRRHRAAQQAQRASVAVHTLLFFRERPARETAYVSAVAADHFSVIVPRFGIEGKLSLADLARHFGSPLRVSPETHRAECDGFSVQVFQRVTVGIRVEQQASGRRLAIGLVLDCGAEVWPGSRAATPEQPAPSEQPAPAPPAIAAPQAARDTRLPQKKRRKLRM